MRFKVTYTRTMTLTQVIEANSVEEANALAIDEYTYLKDMDFEKVSTDHTIELVKEER